MENEEVIDKLGPKHPYVALDEALELAKAVSDLGGTKSEVQKALVAKHLKAEENSSAFGQKIGSAKTFGMLKGYKAFSLTDIARLYFYPEDQAHPKGALIAFLKTPPAYQFLVKRFDGAQLPDSVTLSNILANAKYVADSWKLRVAQMFIRSAKSAGVIDGSGILRVASTEQELQVRFQDGSRKDEASPPPPERKESEKLPEARQPNAPGIDVYAFDDTVELRVRRGFELATWEKLLKIVDAIKPAK